MLDVSRTRYLTEHYADLQGLRLIPLAVLFLASAAWRVAAWSWLTWRPVWGSRWFATGLVLALASSAAIGTVYRSRLGTVSPRRRTSAIATWVVFGVGVSLLQETARPWPVSLPFLFTDCVLAYVGCAGRGLRRHYLAVAIACLLFALTPLWSVPMAARRLALDLLIGFGLLVAGVGDHVVLQQERRALQEVLNDARAA